MDVLRTPDSRFENLEGYPFVANYVDVAASDTQPLRMHFLDEGPDDGPPIVLLHGEPTWSYLYRTMIPPLADGGNPRARARPDRLWPLRQAQPDRGLHLPAACRVGDVVVRAPQTEGRHAVRPGLGIADRSAHRRRAGRSDRAAGGGERFPAHGAAAHPSRLRPRGGPLRATPPCCPRVTSSPPAPSAGFRPRCGPATTRHFPDKTYQAGARAFPQLVPTSPDDPAVPANRAAWEALGRWEKPFLAIFGHRDPILGRADRPLIKHIPGAAGQPHARINASHFIQEDSGPELAERVLSWLPPVPD